MKRFVRLGVFLIAAFAASALGLHAQSVIYATDFPDDQGWTFVNWNGFGVTWAVDATPATVLGSPSWHSAPFSLNFNDGVQYGSTVSNFGTATSPPIDLSVATGPVTLGFWCNWDTEDIGACTGYDRRILYVLNNSGQVAQHCYYPPGCPPAGTWHAHSVPLDPSWGVVQLRFFFETGDFFMNDGAGWLVDDLEVAEDCSPTVAYCTAKQNSLGCTPSIFTTGTPSASGQGAAFRIRASSVLNQKPGLMLWSRSPASTSFGGGTLCVAAPITRTAAQNSQGTALPAQDCTGIYAFHFTPALMSQAGLVPGDDVYSQYWSRDPGFPPPNDMGLTGGAHWVVCN
jgi:hypothetical protein